MVATNAKRHALVGSLFGRRIELKKISDLLHDPATGCITLYGPVGMGTSRLAAEAVRRFGSGYDRVLRIGPVRGRQTAGRQLERAIESLRRPDRPSARARSDSRILAVVDAEDRPLRLVRELRAAADRRELTVLACAVRPLDVPGGRTIAVGPLPLSPVGAPPGVHRGSPGVALFLERVAASQPEAVITDADLDTVAELCARLDGWPLAIALAAERTPWMTPTRLMESLRDDRECLLQLAPPLESATPSMREALARTLSAIPREARLVTAATSLFHDSFTGAQAAAVVDLPGDVVPRALASLGKLHLVEATRGATRPESGYRLSRLLRAFAGTDDSVAPSPREYVERYVDVIGGIVGRVHALAIAGREDSAIALAGAMQSDLITVFDLQVQRREMDAALRTGGVLAMVASRLGRHQDIADRLARLLRDPDLPPGPSLASALTGHALLVLLGPDGRDRREQAIKQWRRGLTMLRDQDEPAPLLRALSVMVQGFPVTHDVPLIQECLREGLQLATSCGDVRWLARFEAWAGMFAHQVGDLERASSYAISALVRSRRVEDPQSRMLAGLLLRTLPELPPQVPGGVPSLTELADLSHTLNEPRRESIVLVTLADFALKQGHYGRAAELVARALRLVLDHDTWIASGMAIMTLVFIAVARADNADAARLHGMVIDRMSVLLAHLPPHVVERYHRTVADLENSLPAAEYLRETRRGVTSPWRHNCRNALAYALQVAHSPSVIDRSAPSHADAGDRPRLTPRERQVVALIGEGLDNRSIAQRLDISINAVWHHASHIFQKLGVQNRSQAAIWALQHVDEMPPADASQ